MIRYILKSKYEDKYVKHISKKGYDFYHNIAEATEFHSIESTQKYIDEHGLECILITIIS